MRFFLIKKVLLKNRENRSGAFWEDNYHATAVDELHYLHHCMVYIDLNMVRAGVVNHPFY
jgi:putative transposase